MVILNVANGKIATTIRSDPYIPIYEELGQGITQLLVDFQVEAVRRGDDPQKVAAAYDEMMKVINRKAKEMAEKVIRKCINGKEEIHERLPVQRYIYRPTDPKI